MTRCRIVPALLLAVLAAGCQDFLDVNDNPNAPEHARVDLRLPALIAAFGHSVYYGDTQLWSAEWVQQFSYNRETRNYSEVHRYELQENDASHAWNFYFSQVMNEARLIMAETDPETDGPYHGLAKFFWAWTWAHVTDMWGPVPFEQAFDTSIPDPEYDDQQLVYAAVHEWFEEAIADMQRPSLHLPGANDLLFEGDMTRWVKLARVVQARHHLRLAYAPGEDPAGRAQQALNALQQGFTSNADDADFIYLGGEGGARNPHWTFQDLDQFRASEFMVQLLQARDDPRLPIMVRPAQYDSVRGDIVYRGHKNGAASEVDSTMSQVGHFFSNEDAPLNWASYADAKFLEAEARLIVGGAAAADAPYREAIRANMEKWGVAAGEIDAYLAARPSLTQVANPLEEIMTQKYIANYLKVDPWNDWRRTGYPLLEIVEDAVLPGIPQRIRTPGSELSNNSENVRETGIDIGLDGMVAKVWWALQGPPASLTGGAGN
jgi:hypothetical protein